MSLALVPMETIAAKIYLIRNQKVTLDRSLAKLYGVETRTLKQAVRRNIQRFPKDFMFELPQEEEDSLKSQTVTLKGVPDPVLWTQVLIMPPVDFPTSGGDSGRS